MWKLRPILVLVCVLSAVHNSSQRSTPESSEYVAAVVEYHPETTIDASTTYSKNVDNYIALIEEAANATNNADIIVFPEAGLSSLYHKVFTLVPLPEENIVPCTEVGELYENLRRLSCAAKENEIYVVVNLSEKFICPEGSHTEYHEECPTSGVVNYNTNVVFDRNGAVISKYRKYNLFGEAGMVSPPTPDMVTFNTDFNVTFGMFICFDIIFEQPAVHLVKTMGITDIIFPTAWFSELPFLTAVQAQAAWAYGMDVNFLASGYNTPAVGSAGSGIFAGRNGPLVYVMPTTNATKLLIHSVQKINRNEVDIKQHSNGPEEKSVISPISHTNKLTDEFYMKVDNLSPYTTQLLDANTQGEMQLCNNDLCCTFEVTRVMNSDHKEGEMYYNRIVAFDGVRSFDGVATGGVQVCGVVSCTDSTLASCGRVFTDAQSVKPTTFTSIRIRGSFNSMSATQFPNAVVEDYNLVPVEAYSFTQVLKNDMVECEITLVKDTELLTFSIYGRDFTRDGDEATGGVSIVTPLISISLLFVGIVYYLF